MLEPVKKPIETYCALMEDVKLRIAVVRNFTSGNISLGREDLNAEALCVNLRKILETIAFGALVAHRDAYNSVHNDINDRWKPKQILERVEKVHPNFYPKPVTPSRVGGKLHMEEVSAGFLTQAEFETLYNKCSDMLHFWNPFREDRRELNFGRSLNEWCDLIENLLRHHVVWLRTEADAEPRVCVNGVPESGDGWLVYLSQTDDGRTHAFPFTPSPSEPATDGGQGTRHA